MVNLKLINSEQILRAQSPKRTTQYSHLAKQSMLTERAKFELFCEKQEDAFLAAEKFRLSMDAGKFHEDILTPQNIEKLLNKYHINIPKKGFYCPHFNLWVGQKKKNPEDDTRIPSEKFENVAIMLFHEWVINWFFFKRFVIENPKVNLDEDDSKKYGIDRIEIESCYEAMLKYFGHFSVQCWSEEKKKFLNPANLLQELSRAVYKTFDTTIAVRSMQEETTQYIFNKRMPRIRSRIYETIGAKKTPPKLSRRKGSLDRIAEKMDSADVKEQFEMVKELSKDSKYKLRKKGVDIPTIGELIASMSNEEFDAWCKEKNITRANKSYYKRRYRDGKE